jgi:hypothetical protein
MKWPEITGNCAENHRNFSVLFPPDPDGNEMEDCWQNSDDFQTENASPEIAGYDRFR